MSAMETYGPISNEESPKFITVISLIITSQCDAGRKERRNVRSTRKGCFSWIAIEHVFRCRVHELQFHELKSFNEGHSDRLDTWPRWPGFRPACVLANCPIASLCCEIRQTRRRANFSWTVLPFPRIFRKLHPLLFLCLSGLLHPRAYLDSSLSDIVIWTTNFAAGSNGRFSCRMRSYTFFPNLLSNCQKTLNKSLICRID